MNSAINTREFREALIGRITFYVSRFTYTICMKTVLFMLFLFLTSGIVVGGEYIWIEAENPEIVSPIKPAEGKTRGFSTGGWGKTHLISEGKWLSVNVKADEIEKRIPEEGAVFAWPFEIAETGIYEVWARVGFEWIRADFDWRIDDGEWKRIKAKEHTTVDLKEIAVWNELAWLQLENRNLKAGKHKLQLRLPRVMAKDKKGKETWQRIIITVDAFCLSRKPFIANGPFKPDDKWQTDKDKEAASNVFEMPAPSDNGKRDIFSLEGLWQFAPYDEKGWGENQFGPIQEVPEADSLCWRACQVPGDRNSQHRDFFYNHRFICRTRVNIPAEYEGRRLLLDIAEKNFIATVFVNGKQMGYDDLPLCSMQVDITDGVKFGNVNEIWVGIKDQYYGLQPKPDEKGVRRYFNIPKGMINTNQGVTMRFVYPLRGRSAAGLTDRVRLVAAGQVYTEDTYIIPSVENKTLKVQASLVNPGAAADITVEAEVKNLDSEETMFSIPPVQVSIPAASDGYGKETVTLSGNWESPRLWWPDDPHMYRCVAVVKKNGKVIDRKESLFGFRQWGIEGTRFTLNSIPWQLRTDCTGTYAGGDSIEESTFAFWKRMGLNMFRLRFQRWCGHSQRETLEYMDRNGMPVRRSVGNLDGQTASYRLAVKEGKGKDAVKTANKPLFENWRRCAASMMIRDRNHPCVFTWELDNEIIYINARNFGNLDVVEPEFEKTMNLIKELDQQGRSINVAGGRALMNQCLPINGCHYEAAPDREYPDAAYGLDPVWTGQSKKQPWPMALDKPIFLSEEFYASGRNPSDFAAVGGEAAFAGRAACRPAISRLARMYSEGYRWQELGGFHFWMGRQLGDDSQYTVWQPVLALVRQWNWTFKSRADVKRTVMVRNDTRYTDPITLSWKFTVDGSTVSENSKELQIPAGHGKTIDITLSMPEVTSRSEGELILTCFRKGEEVWKEAKPLSVICPDNNPKPGITEEELAVLDPSGEVKARLLERGIGFTEITSSDEIPEKAEVLVVGRNALKSLEAADPKWLSHANAGLRLLVLEQDNPLQYQAVPADFEASGLTGRIAFMENSTHPVFNGLRQKDFFCWSGDHIVYRNVYRKASKGARSLLQCDDQLGYSAIAECRVGKGVMLLSQTAAAEKLGKDAVAQQLFDNMLNYVCSYRIIRRKTAAVFPEKDPRIGALSSAGLNYSVADSALSVLQAPDSEIVICDASPETLKILAENSEAVDSFTERGGWLMLWGVTPEGLADFNRIVGVEHSLRPFRIERVTLATPRDSLAVGLSQRDLTLYSGRRIAGWQQIEYVAGDVFSYIVDLEDIAPFLKGPGIETPDPNRPSSVVNGFTDAEFWKYICYFPLPEDGSPYRLNYTLPKKETIINFRLRPNSHYNLITKITLIPDSDRNRSQAVQLEDYDKSTNRVQEFELEPMEAEKLTIELTEWKQLSDGKPVGIDNMWLKVKRSDEFKQKVKPLLNCGGLVRYPHGKGGIVLNQVLVKEREAVGVNMEKKMAIVSTILKNLNADFKSSGLLVAGGGLKYTPVSLEGKCNLYITTDKGWFDKKYDLSHLPLSQDRFAGVKYSIRDFKTSPLESAVTLQGLPKVKAPREVRGLELGKKADVLFFLHTMNRKREWKPSKREKNPPVIFQYVINYADGSTEAADVIYGRGADHWIQAEPKPCADAAVAWAAPFTNDNSRQAVLYSMQWNNPHPEKEIHTIDLKYAPRGDRYGTPILFAITMAEKLEVRE